MERRPSRNATSTSSEKPPAPLMETVILLSCRDPAPTRRKRTTPGGEWTCWSPTSSPPS
ncbi:hypothetical protein EYF80_066209 [Liparis tanakae]|uniref:Uncharacterized protein n=1 Tax=Liparis tanakae TaxID=230148 RepID=A0A4Z2E4I7_9TELE|nr:hypothetical protein EYF80_066209 [Liparis tanakae]